MPTGLKATSSVVAIGFGVTETGANTFTQGQVDLNLSPLDREVFVVLSIDLDPTAPDAIAGVNSATVASLTTTSQTAVSTLDNANCMAVGRLDLRSNAAFVASPGAAFTRQSNEAPSTRLDYIGIIATNDFFIQVVGQNNTLAKSCTGKLYGYRARASADVFAALVQSEVLSA
jgi:hypothetical protein